ELVKRKKGKEGLQKTEELKNGQEGPSPLLSKAFLNHNSPNAASSVSTKRPQASRPSLLIPCSHHPSLRAHVIRLGANLVFSYSTAQRDAEPLAQSQPCTPCEI